uniref:TPR_REGION domain-containing protein n=1 Tax=Rhabditophanes sp. KR3021 TaxID=114890 RepID=A0AC35U2Y7_9BILA
MLSQTHSNSDARTLSAAAYRQEHIEDDIKQCLQYFAYSDAQFLAEIHHTKDKSDSSVCLLANCYIMQNQYESALQILDEFKGKNNDSWTSPETRFIHAKVAYQLGQLDLTEKALKNEVITSDRDIALHPSFNNSNAKPFAHSLLAQTLRETNRMGRSTDFWDSSISQFPVLWSSIKEYCDGGGTNARKKVSAGVANIIETKRARMECLPSGSTESLNKEEEMGGESGTPMNFKEPLICLAAPKKPSRRKSATPINAQARRRGDEKSQDVRRSKRLLQTQGNENLNGERITTRSKNSHESVIRNEATPPVTSPGKIFNNIHTRVNWRLQNTPENNMDRGDMLGVVSTQKSKRATLQHNPLSLVNRTNSEITSHLSDSSTSLASNTSYSRNENEEDEMDDGDMSVDMTVAEQDIERRIKKEMVDSISPVYVEVVEWICKMSEIQECLSKFLCKDALLKLEELPTEFQKSPLVLELRARALFEKADYKTAASVFDELHRLYPHRLEGMEVLSTALWHLQDATRLSSLASELVKNNRKSAIAWCVAGNCYSVQKMHEMAIECLERAIVLNPRFSYAYSVLGHELIDVDKLDKALNCFRKALVYSPYDYRAYFGMGMIYQIKEKFTSAKVHFTKAMEINPHNTKLICQLGVCEQALRNNDSALKLFEAALEISPNDIATKFHRARLLFETKDYQKSLEVLNELKLCSPDEAQIFFLLGHVHKKLSNEHLSNTFFNWASDIDPRGEQSKPLIGSVRHTLEDDHEMDNTLNDEASQA